MNFQNNIKNNTASEKIEKEIEALLFYNGNPLKISEICKILNYSKEKILEHLEILKNNFANRGIKLVMNEDRVGLVTSPDMSGIIDKARKDELTKDLSKSALETLAIVIYRGPIKRSDIDYIRGVNSQFILRMLLVRGLIEKTVNRNDERGFLYKASLDLLNLLGISSIKDLPLHEEINLEIDNFINFSKESDE